MNFSIIAGDDGRPEMSWDAPTDISTILWTSLNIKKGSIPNNPGFGLDLSDIDRVTEQNIDLIQDRLQQAVKWIIDIGRARVINIKTEIDKIDINRVNYIIEAIQSDDTTVQLTDFQYVGGNT